MREGIRRTAISPVYQWAEISVPTLVLAESHVAIHAWPETGDDTLDVHVCDLSMDNGEKARQLFHRLLELLEAKAVASQEVIRGRVRAAGCFVPVDTV